MPNVGLQGADVRAHDALGVAGARASRELQSFLAPRRRVGDPRRLEANACIAFLVY